MSQLACPLCGRFVSLNGFDPSKFEFDIFAVYRIGLGRGRGFSVSEGFSVLDDVTITGPIADRCRLILSMIEGRDIPSSNEVSILAVEIERLKAELLNKERVQQDLYAQLADIERQAIYWKNEAAGLQKVQKQSQSGYKAEIDRLKRMVERLRNEDKSLESAHSEMKEDVDYEGELLAMEEMEILLDRINSSANTTFDYLEDAIFYLLEGN